jgi:hypothetical protein
MALSTQLRSQLVFPRPGFPATKPLCWVPVLGFDLSS